MKTKLILTAISTVFLSSFILSDAIALTAYEIIEKSENAIRGDTSRGIYEITVKTRRWTRTMKLKAYDNKLQKKSFDEIIAPEKDAGTKFLLIDKNMWHYIPKLQQTIKISPSMMLQSWMGSDLTNDDIVKMSSIKTDYTHKLTGNATIDNQKCYKIELKPKPDSAVVWGKMIIYAREIDCLPVLHEFYNEHGVKKRTWSFSEFRRVHDRVIPTVYKVQSVGKEDQYTIMKINDVRYNQAIPGRIFTLQNLQRK